MKKSKVNRNVVKLTVIRDSSYERYMRKFQPRGTCQCRAIQVRRIKPARSDFSLLRALRKIISHMADQKMEKNWT